MANVIPAADLPTPGQDALEHSDKLKALIRAEIEAAAEAMITFARFMELASYAPGLGYYAAGARKFGEAGDFITAPEISPLYSQCLAQQCQQVLTEIGHGDILEFGAGTGVMASDILLELEACHSLPNQYFILELSADLRQRQQQALKEKVPHLFGRLCWLDALPESGFHGVVLANEVVDAMPVHVVQRNDDGFSERYVAWQNGGFVWQDAALGSKQLIEIVETIAAEVDEETFCSGYQTEINLAQHAWMNSIAAMLEQGVVLMIDYGFPRKEYYHSDRTTGTLMCHYRHRAHGDPLILAGLQDITAHVDFTALAEAAHGAGLDVMGYTSQAQFLLASGLGERLERFDPEDTRRYLNVSQAVKKLTMPNEMGELFKVLAVSRNLDADLTGFALQDRRARL